MTHDTLDNPDSREKNHPKKELIIVGWIVFLIGTVFMAVMLSLTFYYRPTDDWTPCVIEKLHAYLLYWLTVLFINQLFVNYILIRKKMMVWSMIVACFLVTIYIVSISHSGWLFFPGGALNFLIPCP
ncbi:MAG: hypothetical protein ACI9EQ_001904 [Bacteroidia bacterium]|jgi:hypothetical protein